MAKSDWKVELVEARGYTRTVLNAHEKNKFDNTFRFNLLTLALEKYLVCYLNYIKYPPVTHGLSTLMADVVRKKEVSAELKEGVNKIAVFQDICGGDELRVPNAEELTDMLDVLKGVRDYVENDVDKEV